MESTQVLESIAEGSEKIGQIVIQTRPFFCLGVIVSVHRIERNKSNKGSGRRVKKGNHYLIDFYNGKKFVRHSSDIDFTWKIQQIYQSAYDNGNHDYSINHPVHFPQGHVIMNTNFTKLKSQLPC